MNTCFCRMTVVLYCYIISHAVPYSSQYWLLQQGHYTKSELPEDDETFDSGESGDENTTGKCTALPVHPPISGFPRLGCFFLREEQLEMFHGTMILSFAVQGL